MADAFGSYFATHARGLALNAKRVLQAEQTSFEVGDCQFADPGHHGTPLQRLRSATWGVENRTCALRVIGGSAKSQRVEYRIAAADINPYLALAAAIGSGLWGMERKIEPGAPVEGNAYAIAPSPERALPTTLWEAAQRLRGSAAARELFGGDFVDHYAATREWEEREARKAVTDWQLARYFEII